MKKIALIVVIIVLCVSINSIVFSAEVPSTPAIQDKPLLGMCIITTDLLKRNQNSEPEKLVFDATNAKLSRTKYSIVDSVTTTDLVTFLNKKDIMTDSTGLLHYLKLPVFLEYAQKKNLDYLVVIVRDVHLGNQMAVGTSWPDNATAYLRVIMVDVKKGEYIYNGTFSKQSSRGSVFSAHNFAWFINSATKNVLKDFNQQVTFE